MADGAKEREGEGEGEREIEWPVGRRREIYIYI